MLNQNSINSDAEKSDMFTSPHLENQIIENNNLKIKAPSERIYEKKFSVIELIEKLKIIQKVILIFSIILFFIGFSGLIASMIFLHNEQIMNNISNQDYDLLLMVIGWSTGIIFLAFLTTIIFPILFLKNLNK